MKRGFLFIFVWALLLNGIFSQYSLDAYTSDHHVALAPTFQAPGRRGLLSDANLAHKGVNTSLVAEFDGTITLMGQSGVPIWSFSSGGDLYSAYQAPQLLSDKDNLSAIEGHYYIDIGQDDWQLYAHHSFGPPQKLMTTVEEYVNSTPHILEDGRIVIGSTTSSVFLVDGITGRVIEKCEFSDHQHTADKFPLSESELTLPIHITRKDYRLKSYMPLNSEVLWNVSVAEIGVAFLCQGIENSFEVTLSNSESFESGLTYNMPLPCQSQANIFRFRKPNIFKSLRVPNALPEADQHNLMLPLSEPGAAPPQPSVGEIIEHVQQSISVNFQDAQNSSDPGGIIPLNLHNRSSAAIEREENIMKSRVHLWFLVPIVLIMVFFLCWLKFLTRSTDTTTMVLHSKKKRLRKPGKGGTKTGKQDKEESESNYTYKESENNFWANLDRPICYGSAGQRIGKLFVSSDEIGKGSNGTVVLEGIYQGRPVAVKRLVRSHNEIALKEIQNLIASDQHPNIISWYGVEEDKDFVYLALERCTCSLNDLIIMCTKASVISTLDQRSEAEIASESMFDVNCKNGFKQSIELWKSDGYPSPSLLKLMRDVITGVAHLHEIGIVHRDLKPQNVLITNERSLCAKVSDMGISKRLVGNMSSFGNNATGSGSSGWQAPEQLLQERQTRAVDMFSLGCVLFYCITGGKHPFGDHLERDSNIVKNKFDLFRVEYIPEAVDLFFRLLHPDPEMRPKALEVLCHPLFWNAEMRLSFLRDTSDRVELEDREASSELLQELECIASVALGAKWDEKMDSSFLNNIGRYRRYKYDSVRDLLRVMRNKLNHYRELPAEIQGVIGPVPEGFDRYFTSRFPKLLIEVYKVMLTHCRTEELFAKYFEATTD